MPTSEENLRKYFANNLCHYRKQLGLTQTELAEKLNYSDKSVSKWERGEGLPDLIVTAQIADIFGLSVNDMIAEKPRRHLLTPRNKTIFTMLAIGGAWLIATILFFLFELIMLHPFPSWKLFVYAVPISTIIAIVCCSVWWKKFAVFASTTSLIWSLAVSLQISFSVSKFWLIFIVAAVLQVLTTLAFLIKKQ